MIGVPSCPIPKQPNLLRKKEPCLDTTHAESCTMVIAFQGEGGTSLGQGFRSFKKYWQIESLEKQATLLGNDGNDGNDDR